MKHLRWKRRYESGDAAEDADNKQLTRCLNQFVEASAVREHCKDMDDLVGQMVSSAEGLLRDRRPRQEIEGALRTLLGDTLPLASYRSPACHKCGVCELSAASPAPHLAPSSNCLKLH